MMEITPEVIAAGLERLRWPKIDVRLSADDREWLEELGFYALFVEPGYTELRHPDGLVVLDRELFQGFGPEYERYIVTSTRGDTVLLIEQERVGAPYDTATVRILSGEDLALEYPYALERLARAAEARV